MRRLGLVPGILALVGVAAAAGPVQAAPMPRVINMYTCDQDGAGSSVVPANKHAFLDYGWETKNRRQTYDYLSSVKTIVKIDGVRIVNADFYWSEPYIDQYGYWSIYWRYPLAKFALGESHTMTLQSKFKTQITDGWDFYGPGNQFHPALACTITGV
jgi:hypothetical protein